jgi:predicted glycoside hydrolase/deacetylase ChbG (UPF0249 family)
MTVPMPAAQPRHLVVIADAFGIGDETTAGILQLAARGVVTGSALLVNCPTTLNAIQRWRQSGSTLELGWHPNLTLDNPVAAPSQIPTLVQTDGAFWPLRQFLKRWLFGRFKPADIEHELARQLERFTELVGHPPTFVNFHQHLALFAPIGKILLGLLAKLSVRPYFRRVREPWSVVRRLPGARLKRVFLGTLGRRFARLQQSMGFPGNDWLAGIGNPKCIADPQFFSRWLRTMPGQVVELMCHPGRLDPTLLGRDCTETDGLLTQRVNELRWLQDPSFVQGATEAGFRLTAPSKLLAGAVPKALCS